MKTLILLWLASSLVCSAMSGSSIVPMVVHVVDSNGKPVPGATVTIRKGGLEKIIKKELDPESDFRGLAEAASSVCKTDLLGMTLVYFGSGLGISEIVATYPVKGEIHVEAKGFQPAMSKIETEVFSTAEGQPRMFTQVIKITLKKKP